MSDQIDISREVCNEMAFRLHRLGEYEVAQLEGYSLWPFADIILALRAALDAADARASENADRVRASLERVEELVDAARDGHQALVDAAEEIAEMRVVLSKTDLEFPWIGDAIGDIRTALAALEAKP